MATNFPASLDSLTNPTSSDSLNSPSHSAQHANANDAIEALQAKVGVDSSAVTTSLDYRVTTLEGAGAGMETSATPPVSPSDGDLWYDTDDGRTYVYYDDGTSAQWVEFGAPAVQHGKILQVQSTVKTDDFSTTANGPVDVTGLSVSITPTASSSTILVMVTVPTTGGAGVKNIWIKRDSTDILTTTNGSVFRWATQSTTDPAVFTIQGVDSPATTSATTYKVQIGTSGANTVRVGKDNAGATYYMASSITVMEVAG